MTESLDPTVFNLLYAMLGLMLTLIFIWLGCKIFNQLVHFDIRDQLGKGNKAVGLMVLGISIGVGIAMGLAMGLGLK